MLEVNFSEVLGVKPLLERILDSGHVFGFGAVGHHTRRCPTVSLPIPQQQYGVTIPRTLALGASAARPRAEPLRFPPSSGYEIIDQDVVVNVEHNDDYNPIGYYSVLLGDVFNSRF